MNGSVQIKNGKWYTVIQYKDHKGIYKQKWQNTGLKERGNKKAAQAILEQRLNQAQLDADSIDAKVKKRLKSDDSKVSLRSMLFSDYCKKFVEEKKDKLSPFVYNHYMTHHLKVFKDYFKELTLIDITNVEIEGFINSSKNKGIKNTTISHYCDILRPSLKQAYLNKIIPDNPFDKIKLGAREKMVMNYYNKDELELFFKAIKGHKLEMLFKIAAHYGLRRSELVGLRWNSINFDHNTISINHKVLKIKKEIHVSDELKSNSSRRTLPLIENVRQPLLDLKRQIENNRALYGDSYNTKWLDYVFVNELGVLINPDYIYHSFKKVLKSNNLKDIRFHDLRHSCASLLLANGISLKQVQEWLGHADFSLTANVYSHLDFSTKVQSANAINNALSFQNESERNTQAVSTLETIKQEMRKLGVENLDEYIKLLSCEDNNTKGNDDITM